MDIEMLAFFERDSAALALYEAFRDALLARWPRCEIKSARTQISFADGVGFAFISHPPRQAPGAVLVSLGLRAPLQSPRVFAQTEPYPGRWTVHILVHAPSEIDAEFMGWLEEAHEYAVERSARRRKK